MNQELEDKESGLPTSAPGNASNPPANGEDSSDGNQLLPKEAEKYLREAGNIEDMPDEKDWQDAEEIRQRENG